jgi:hypothetical protein
VPPVLMEQLVLLARSVLRVRSAPPAPSVPLVLPVLMEQLVLLARSVFRVRSVLSGP